VEEDLLLVIRDAGSADTRQLRILIFARNVERGFDRRKKDGKACVMSSQKWKSLRACISP
jgi:hypothetical protein